MLRKARELEIYGYWNHRFKVTMEEQMQSISWYLFLQLETKLKEVLFMLQWHAQDYLPQHLNEQGQMQYIIVLSLTMSIILS